MLWPVYQQPNRPRFKAETRQKLSSFFELAKSIGTKTRIKTEKTETGIKDTVQEFFLDKLYTSYKNTKPNQTKQEALDVAINNLPPDITSPVWRLDKCIHLIQHFHFNKPIQALTPIKTHLSKFFMWSYLASSNIFGVTSFKIKSMTTRSRHLFPASIAWTLTAWEYHHFREKPS